jgi:pimeloyl-ACP methyl ester carboxylesterase
MSKARLAGESPAARALADAFDDVLIAGLTRPMSRTRREVCYLAPLKEPVETQAYVAESAGPWRLVMFPGTPARRYLFDRILKLAPDDLEVVLLMRPGFERGARRAFTDFEDQVAIARPFLDGKKIVALGVSYGGELALKAALDFPERIKGVVTLAALITEPRPWVQPFVDLGGAPVIRSILPRTLHHSRAEVAARRAQIDAVFSRLKDIKCPATILHGDIDHLVASSDAETLKGYFAPGADVKYQRVRGGTHFLELQFPRLVLRAVADVIARAERGA